MTYLLNDLSPSLPPNQELHILQIPCTSEVLRRTWHASLPRIPLTGFALLGRALEDLARCSSGLGGLRALASQLRGGGKVCKVHGVYGSLHGRCCEDLCVRERGCSSWKVSHRVSCIALEKSLMQKESAALRACSRSGVKHALDSV